MPPRPAAAKRSLMVKVTALWRYPVKSMQGERLSRAWLGLAGIPGDRRWAVVEAGSGRVLSAKRLATLMTCRAALTEEEDDAIIRLADGRELRCGEGKTEAALSAFLGLEARLEDAPGSHFDARPIHLLTTATLAELSRRALGSAFDPRRFRPNVVVNTDQAGGFPELSWSGLVRIGQAALRLDKPTRRCVMTTHPQAELPRDPAVLQAAVDATGGDVGVYASVESPGWVREGDEIAFD